MLVRCLASDGARLPASFMEAGFTPRSQFHVTPNREYRVAAIGVVTGVVCYLVKDDSGFPNWTPAPVFEVLDNSVPYDWAFTYLHRSKQLPGVVDAIFGHHEIANDPALPDALMNREPDALERFDEILRSEA